jgi:syntaxin 8
MQPFDSAGMLESQRLMMQGMILSMLPREYISDLLLLDQDNHLDSLHTSLTRQHSLSQELSSEFDAQAGLLTELDDDVDNTTSRVGQARRSLDKVGRGLGANGQSSISTLLFQVSNTQCRTQDQL